MGCEAKDSGGMKDMMGMMSKMMEGCGPEVKMDMMTQCVGTMFQQMPKEKRTDFALKAIDTFMKQGTTGMSESEKKDFMKKVVEKLIV